MPLKRERRPELVAFGRVVVDDVEDHLEPGVVEARDHLLEFLQRCARGRRRSADRARRSRCSCSPSSW